MSERSEVLDSDQAAHERAKLPTTIQRLGYEPVPNVSRPLVVDSAAVPVSELVIPVRGAG